MASSAVPEHCPGVESTSAGSASACSGCPNQTICSSGLQKRAVEEEAAVVQVVKQRLASVKHKLLVLSGKGGVGKSTVSAGLCYALAVQRGVGLLDVDICGPSAPRILGLAGETVHQSGSGWSPVFVQDNLCAMSVGFLLDGPDQAVVWRGPRKGGMIKQFLMEVDWEGLDVMVVDTPPGTSDEHLSITHYLSDAMDGAILVTTPQEVALSDVRKEANFCKRMGLKIIGVVENMSAFQCPKCHVTSSIFPPTTGGAEKMAADMDIPFLGRIPLDPNVARCCDEGKNFLDELPNSAASASFHQLATKVMESIQKTA